MTSLIWDFLFSNGNFPSRIFSDFFRIALFQRRYIFGEGLFSKKLYFRRNFISGETLFYRSIILEATSSYFFRATISTQQLHFWGQLFLQSSCFFGGSFIFERFIFLQQLFFHKSYFFSERNFYRVATS